MVASCLSLSLPPITLDSVVQLQVNFIKEWKFQRYELPSSVVKTSAQISSLRGRLQGEFLLLSVISHSPSSCCWGLGIS